MTSLYDLLGAHVNDDAEALKKAFRNAVKAYHPDLHPGDPEAALRFKQIIGAYALLRDAKQRAIYDRLLQLERQKFQWKLEYQQRQSKHVHRQQRRSTRTRVAVAVAVVCALAGGYRLFGPMLATTTIVAIKNERQAATTGASVKKGRQTANVVAAALEENKNTSAAVATAKVDAVNRDLNKTGEPIEMADAQSTERANPADQGAPRHMAVGAEVSGASPSGSASETNSGEVPDLARELALGPPSSNANFHRELGIALYRSGDFQQAIANFDEAIRLDPGDAQAFNIRGNAWDDMGRFERALADYGEAIRIDPSNPAIFRDRAILWQRRGALDKALIDLDRAIRFSFADANMYCDRGLVWYEKGRYERAVADFNHATRLDPNSAAVCISRGVILHRKGEFDGAVADAGKAIHVDPSIFDVTRRTNVGP